jgi:rhodanese-related sulfurtransferase
MLFDRYRSKKSIASSNEKPAAVKKSSLANSFLKRFPIHLSSNYKKKQSKKHDDNSIINQPRPSLSLPNIATIVNEPPPPPPPIRPRKPSIPSSKQRKRHSAEQRRRRHHLVSMQDVNRHSFTFGHFPSNDKQLTMAELSLDPDQLAKLKSITIKDNTEALLAKLGSNTQPHVLVPHRSISHQHLTVPMQQSRQPMLSRAHSESHVKTREREADPMEPQELAELLSSSEENQEVDIILIDVRHLIDYQKSRIRGSINVNLPSLLIKRYQRGTVSNFNLENFITTSEGRDIYATKYHTKQQQFATILEQKAAEQQKKKKKTWVVYDDTMSEDDQTSQAWTLLNVLERFIGTDKKSEGQVHYLCGGYQAFEATVSEAWLESSLVSSLPSPPASTSSTGSYHHAQQLPQLKLNTTNNNNIPRRSISYTIGESKTDLSKRTSLFSLDTQAARVNNANALARRAKRRSEQQQQQQKQDTTLRPRSIVQQQHEPNQTLSQPQQQQQQQQQPLIPTHQPPLNNLLNRVTEDDEMGLMTADMSPRTETDFSFIISEIIPGFLFVGPEIETDDQAKQLTQERQIKRVLNMAEECHDEGLRNHTVVYHKIAARDTLEMKNIELVMMEAVHFIGKYIFLFNELMNFGGT